MPTGGGDLVTDSSGNIYVIGNGYKDCGIDKPFFMKYDNNGNAQWVKQIKSAGFNDIAIDQLNNIYISGYAADKVLFLDKYNKEGEYQWTTKSNEKSIVDYFYTSQISIDFNGDIYVAGSQQQDIGNRYYTGEIIYKNGNVVLNKYDSLGNLKWARFETTTNGIGGMYSQDVTTDKDGNVYVVGRTHGLFDDHLSAGGSSNVFVIKYDSQGNKQWSKLIGKESRDEGHGISTDSEGNVYVIGVTVRGNHSNAIDQGSIDGTQDGHIYSESFIIKYSSDGSEKWTKIIRSSSGLLEASNIYVDSKDNIYLTGDIISDFYYDFFIKKFDSAGNQIWSEIVSGKDDRKGLNYGRNGSDFSYGSTLSDSGDIYVTGSTTYDFDEDNKRQNGFFVYKHEPVDL